MAYQAPSVGPSGIVVSNYNDILADNLQGFLNIYGQDQYVGQDSQIYQFLSILSLKIAHVNELALLVYNQMSPQSAVQAGLDRLVKFAGIARQPATYSTVQVTLTGTPGAVITNGGVQDVNGNLWALPQTVTIGSGGTASAIATCTVPGSIQAAVNTVNIIATPASVTPVGGWTAVTNPTAASPGEPVEPDSVLRARFQASASIPSLTPIAKTIAAVLAVPGVTRIAPGYPTPGGPGTSIENPTSATDSWGNPPKSISIVVENGDPNQIAMAIYKNKTLGCLTNGTTTVTVTDPIYGFQSNISFYRPTYVPIYVNCAIKGYAQPATSAMAAQVQTAIVNYLQSLMIGETVSYSALIYEAMATNANISTPSFGVTSMTIGTSPSSLSAADIPMPNFYSVAQGIAANVTVTYS
jgi:uncharacterized phage protein gp47/JayE